MADSRRVYGIHAVEHCLRSVTPECLFIRDGRDSVRLKELLELAREVGCPIKRISGEGLSDLIEGQKSHQGVVLIVAGPQPEISLEQLLQEPKNKRLFLILDGVTDPGNLGACLRSAATLGVDAVIAPKNASAPLNADAIKRSSGGAGQVPYIQVVNLARCIKQLQAAGVWVVGTVLEAGQSITDIDLNDHIAIVMGSESKGLRDKTRKYCDFLARIPMVNDALGFNVSVAAGICLYEVQRQRTHP
ncbi:MAG: 23S rRNA (guanosine(2251)-2'-O)-methyltransferase RlmB [Gammaproteobacteria bacterium]|nr:23S rRNA (guanosine(2251)-2'-O)-methyltransferase RlmB [Gammaproteobacteria bacterium]